MKMNFVKAFSMLTVSTMLFFSCQKEEFDIESANEERESIMVKDGYLVFSNSNIFKETQESIAELSETELQQWESSLGSFESQRSIYSKALDADLQLKEKLEALIDSGERDVESIIQNGEHIAPYVKQNRELFNFDEDGTFDLTIEYYAPNIEYFVNKFGVVQIGDSIFHYSDGFIRIITDSNEDHLANIEDFMENDKENNITVLRVNKSLLELNSPDGKEFHGINLFSGPGNCTGQSGKERVLGSIYYIHTGTSVLNRCYPNNVVYKVTYIFKAINQYKYWVGWSKKATNYLKIEGRNISWVGDLGEGWNFDKTTGGSTQSEISHSIVHPLEQCDDYSAPTLSGTAYFYGRGGTKCTL